VQRIVFAKLFDGASPGPGPRWFLGKEMEVHHLGELYSGTFVMEPDYPRVETVGLTRDVALTYSPLKISVAYADQTPVPRPFLMIVNGFARMPAGRWRQTSHYRSQNGSGGTTRCAMAECARKSLI
jgi:hypothetical protein